MIARYAAFKPGWARGLPTWGDVLSVGADVRDLKLMRMV